MSFISGLCPGKGITFQNVAYKETKAGGHTQDSLRSNSFLRPVSCPVALETVNRHGNQRQLYTHIVPLIIRACLWLILCLECLVIAIIMIHVHKQYMSVSIHIMRVSSGSHQSLHLPLLFYCVLQLWLTMILRSDQVRCGGADVGSELFTTHAVETHT
jgi:hypothetical protein